MKADKNEQNWDKLLHIHTMGRDDSRSDQYRYPYEPTPYSVLERLENTGYIRKEIPCWIMAAERAGWISSCLIRLGVILSVWNMMTGFMQRRWKIKRPPCPAGEYPSHWQMRKNTLCRKQLTVSTFLIRFHWKSCKKQLHGFWILIMKLHGR